MSRPEYPAAANTISINPIEITRIWQWSVKHGCNAPLVHQNEMTPRRISIVQINGPIVGMVHAYCADCGLSSGDLTDWEAA